MVRRQSGNLDRLRNLHVPLPGKTKRVLRDHAALVDAIAAGDAEAAQAALREHLASQEGQTHRILLERPDFGRTEQFAEVMLDRAGTPGSIVTATVKGYADGRLFA